MERVGISRVERDRLREQVFLHEIKRKLLDLGAMTACMTGSGPTVFGIFYDENRAQDAAQALGREFTATYCCKNINKPV